jgi:hypothetical protein
MVSRCRRYDDSLAQDNIELEQCTIILPTNAKQCLPCTLKSHTIAAFRTSR